MLHLRGISFEVGGHINDRLWQGCWDFVFVVSSFLLAIHFGAAGGNLARGVPIDASGNFSMAFFTNFNVRGTVGLLDWYTISVAIFATVLLAAHGATYLVLKTEGPVHDRSEAYAKKLWTPPDCSSSSHWRRGSSATSCPARVWRGRFPGWD